MKTANHIIKVASNVYYSVNGKVRVQKLSGTSMAQHSRPQLHSLFPATKSRSSSWIVSKVHNDGRYFEAVGGFLAVREALVFAEGVEA
jgi:hypothetical protein